MKIVNVKIKKLTEDAIIPTYSHDGDAGADIYANEDVVIMTGQTVNVKTGIAVAIPDGYYIAIVPRSGISSKTNIRVPNSPGTVDAPYRGEVGVPLTNISQISESTNNIGTLDDKNHCGAIKIRKGDRIAQMILREVPRINFEEVDELSETSRSTGGFGSTGISDPVLNKWERDHYRDNDSNK